MTATAGRTASMTVRGGQLLLKGQAKPSARPVVADDVSRQCQSSPTGISYLTAVKFIALLETSKEPFETVFARLMDEVRALERSRCCAAIATLRVRGSERGQSAHSALTAAIGALKVLT